MTLKIGDKVAWASQAQGSTTEKTGTVVMTRSEAHQRLASPMLAGNPVRLATGLFPDHRLMFDGRGWNCTAKQEGVLVEVVTGPRAKKRLYKPVPSVLRKI